jgi:hypothetical protein
VPVLAAGDGDRCHSHGPQQRGNLPPGLNRLGRIATVLERISVTLGSARGLSAVQSTPAVRHRGRLAPAPSPCPRSTAAAEVHRRFALHGVDPQVLGEPPRERRLPSRPCSGSHTLPAQRNDDSPHFPPPWRPIEHASRTMPARACEPWPLVGTSQGRSSRHAESRPANASAGLLRACWSYVVFRQQIGSR